MERDWKLWIGLERRRGWRQMVTELRLCRSRHWLTYKCCRRRAVRKKMYRNKGLQRLLVERWFLFSKEHPTRTTSNAFHWWRVRDYSMEILIFFEICFQALKILIPQGL